MGHLLFVTTLNFSKAYIRPLVVFLGLLAWFSFLASQRLIAADEGFYLIAAKKVFLGEQVYRDFFYPQMPLFPYLYGCWMWLTGLSWCSARFLSALFAAGTGLILYLRGQEFHSRAGGLLALLLFISSGFIVGWYPIAKTYAPATFFLIAAYYCTVTKHPIAVPLRFFLAGIFVGFSVSMRLFYIAIIPIFLFYAFRSSRRALIFIFLGCFSVFLLHLPLILGDFDTYWFNNLGYHLIRTHRTAAADVEVWWKTFNALIGVSLLPRSDGYQYPILLLGIVVCGVQWFRGKGLRGKGFRSKISPDLAWFLGLMLFVVQLLPTPLHYQYFASTVPFFILVAVKLAVRSGQRPWQLAVTGVLLCCYLIPTPRAYSRFMVTGEGVKAIDSRTLGMRTIDAVQKVSAEINRLTEPGDEVWSRWPGYLFESHATPIAGYENQFWVRVQNKLSPEELSRYRLPPKDGIKKYLRGDKRAAIVIEEHKLRDAFSREKLAKRGFIERFARNGIVLFTRNPHQQRPNIVLIMADDMGLADSSAYQDWTNVDSADQIRTPNIERLAKMGVRFVDAHSPSTRCTATRYALLTGRYSWRTRLKSYVLPGPQSEPLLERTQPTFGTLLQNAGYQTGISGKWHLGLQYRNSDGEPAKNFDESDYTKGIADGPLNHGFHFFHGTARAQLTSRTQGWLFGDTVVDAIGPKKVDATKFQMKEVGSTDYEMAKRFLTNHLKDKDTNKNPFFLFYSLHSNHTAYNPAKNIDGVPVLGKSFPGGLRSDSVYETDVVLGRLLSLLEQTDDPRQPTKKLLENTLIIFTSDNGAEHQTETATGPLRSNKGSLFEGGHRVPFVVSWKAGAIGDGNQATPGATSAFPVSLIDIFATLQEATNQQSGAEMGGPDSFSLLSTLRGNAPTARPPLVFNDHKQALSNHDRRILRERGATPNYLQHLADRMAWLAIRVDNPVVEGKRYAGQWKLLVDDGLIFNGIGKPKMLFDLSTDIAEKKNRIAEESLTPLISFLYEELEKIVLSGEKTKLHQEPTG